MCKPNWSSFKIANLVVSILTPVTVLILGIIINNSINTAERSASLRSDIYRTIGGDLNDIYSYLAFIGGWKELTPADVIARKRAVDRAMYTYKPFFSKELFETYNIFMREAFATHNSPGTDARIRSEIVTGDGDRRIHTIKKWEPDWADRFTKEMNKGAQSAAYEKFLDQLARDLKL